MAAPRSFEELRDQVENADFVDPDRAALWALQDLGESRDPAAVAVLAHVLNTATSDHARNIAAVSLGLFGAPPAEVPLIAAAPTAKPQLQEAIAEALGKIRSPTAVPCLIQLLGSPHVLVRIKAAHALGQIGDRRGVEPLVRALADEDRTVRTRAAQSLGQLNATEAVEPLKRLYQRERFRPIARKAIKQTLRALGQPAARSD